MSSGTPLVLAFRSTLIALDRETGALKWKASLPMEVRRFFFHEGRVIAAIGYEKKGAVHILEGVRGMSEARVDLHFDPTGAAILKGGKLYLASNDAVACVTTTGRVVFRGKRRGNPTPVSLARPPPSFCVTPSHARLPKWKWAVGANAATQA